MKKIIQVIGLILLVNFFGVIRLKAQTLEALWAKQAGGDMDDIIRDIVTDKNGNVYVLGQFSKEITFGKQTIKSTAGSGFDYFIAKYNNESEMQWVKYLKVEGYVMAIALDNSDNPYVTGGFFNELTIGETTLKSSGEMDVFIAKFDVTGKIVWARKAGGRFLDMSEDIAIDKTGNIIITGIFNQSSDFDNNKLIAQGDAIFIAKYSSAGQLKWVKQSDKSLNSHSYTVNTDLSDNIYITGFFSGSVVFDKLKLENKHNKEQGFIAKYNSSGNIQWAKKAGGVFKHASGMFATVDENGNLFLAGDLGHDKDPDLGDVPATTDIELSERAEFDDIVIEVSAKEFEIASKNLIDIYGFIARYDTNGKAQWAKKLSGTKVNAIAVDKAGNAFISGYFYQKAIIENETLLMNKSDNCKSLFIAGYKSNGKLNFVHNGYGCVSGSSSLALDQDDTIYISGSFYEKATFGNITLNGSVSKDAFVAKFKKK